MIIDGATEQTYTAEEDGNYSVVISNDCGSSQQSIAINVVVGVEEMSALGSISIYPNPAHSNATIAMPTAGNYELTVYNSMGGLVLQTKVVGSVHPLNLGSSPECRILQRRFVYRKNRKQQWAHL